MQYLYRKYKHTFVQ